MKNNIVDDEHMRCISCGKVVYMVDVFARNSFKRCENCQGNHRKGYDRKRKADNRRKARENREEERKEVSLLREKNRLLEKEVRDLKFITRALSEQVEEICNPDPVTDINGMIERKRKKDLT